MNVLLKDLNVLIDVDVLNVVIGWILVLKIRRIRLRIIGKCKKCNRKLLKKKHNLNKLIFLVAKRNDYHYEGYSFRIQIIIMLELISKT